MELSETWSGTRVTTGGINIIISSENRGKKIVETISTINGISQNITIRIFN